MYKSCRSKCKKKIQRLFLSKINDCISENSETEVWLDFSYQFKHISEPEHTELVSITTEIGKLLWYMFNNPEKFL